MISSSWRLKVRRFLCISSNRWWKNWLFDFFKTWTDSTSVRLFLILHRFKIRSRFRLFDWGMSNKSDWYLICLTLSKLERIQNLFDFFKSRTDSKSNKFWRNLKSNPKLSCVVRVTVALEIHAKLVVNSFNSNFSLSYFFCSCCICCSRNYIAFQ